MIIKAVKLFENGYMLQPMAFGGEGKEGFDPKVRYRSSLQNYVIDTGSGGNPRRYRHAEGVSGAGTGREDADLYGQ